MKKFLYLFLIFLLQFNFYLFSYKDSDNLSIKFAFTISRTGAHSPENVKYDPKTQLYTDLLNVNWNGPLELTEVGKRQNLLLGYRHHLRYIKNNILLNATYDPKEILVYSSDTNRTIQSSYAQMHGLYLEGQKLKPEVIKNAVPPLNSFYFSKENEELGDSALPNDIVLVPVHLFYENDHTFLLEKTENCPKLKNYYYEIIPNLDSTKEFMKNITTKYKLVNLIKRISITEEEIMNNYNLFNDIIETIISNYYQSDFLENYKFNEEYSIYELLDDINNYLKSKSFGSVKNKYEEEVEIAKYANLVTFNKLLNWMNKIIEKDINNNTNFSYDPKFVAYFSHDFSIYSFHVCLKKIFNIDQNIYTNFTSFINIELYRNNSSEKDYNYTENDYLVKYIFDENEIFNTSYKNFKDSIEKYYENLDEYNIKIFCEYETDDEKLKKKFNYYILITVILTIIFIGLFMQAIHLYINKGLSLE